MHVLFGYHEMKCEKMSCGGSVRFDVGDHSPGVRARMIAATVSVKRSGHVFGNLARRVDRVDRTILA